MNREVIKTTVVKVTHSVGNRGFGYPRVSINLNNPIYRTRSYRQTGANKKRLVSDHIYRLGFENPNHHLQGSVSNKPRKRHYRTENQLLTKLPETEQVTPPDRQTKTSHRRLPITDKTSAKIL